MFPNSNIAYAALMAATSLMFGSLAHFYEKPVVVIATSCAGTLAVLYGKRELTGTECKVESRENDRRE